MEMAYMKKRDIYYSPILRINMYVTVKFPNSLESNNCIDCNHSKMLRYLFQHARPNGYCNSDQSNPEGRPSATLGSYKKKQFKLTKNYACDV